MYTSSTNPSMCLHGLKPDSVKKDLGTQVQICLWCPMRRREELNNHHREAGRGSAVPIRYGQWLVFLVLLVLKGQCMRREARKLSVTLKGTLCERNYE